MKFRDTLISPRHDEDVHVHVHLDDEVEGAAPDDVEASIERYFARHGLGEAPHVTQRRLRDEVRCCGASAGERVTHYDSALPSYGASMRISATDLEAQIERLWAKLPPGGK